MGRARVGNAMLGCGKLPKLPKKSPDPFLEDGGGEGAGAVGEAGGGDVQRVEDAEVHVGHRQAVASPVMAMLQAHGGTTGQQCRQVGGVVGGAGATAIEDDCVFQETTVAVSITRQLTEEMSDLFAEETVVLGKL